MLQIHNQIIYQKNEKQNSEKTILQVHKILLNLNSGSSNYVRNIA
jgi:hypothetical protein